MSRINILTISITAFSLIFFYALAVDASVYLRGFAPYPHWIWPYNPVELSPKIIFPIIATILTIIFTRYITKCSIKTLKRCEIPIILSIFLISFILQISILFASEGGIFIVIHRTIHPDINGYWMPAITIDSLSEFFKTYPANISSYRGVAPYHPPGSIIYFWIINQLATLITNVFPLPPFIQPSSDDLKNLWQGLKPGQQLGSILGGFGILLITSTTGVVIYYLGKLFYSQKIGIIASILFMFIPSMIFFTPFTDILFVLFTAVPFCFYLRGLKTQNKTDFFIAGLMLFIGGFLTLQILATVFIYACVTFYFYLKKIFTIKEFFIYMLLSAMGFFILPIILYLALEFNSIDSFFAIWGNHDGFLKLRNNYLWLIYNWYDFFLFFGIPLLFIFLVNLIAHFKDLKKNRYNLDAIFVGITIFLTVINVTGVMNGETSRTWMPFIPFVLLPLAAFINKIDKTNNLLSVIIFLQSLQAIVVVNYLITIS